jgi:hypothetical protein
MCDNFKIYHMESGNQAYEKFRANQRKRANAAFKPKALDPPAHFAPLCYNAVKFGGNSLV